MVSLLEVRRRFATADAVYGTILFSALIGTISTDESTTGEVLLFSALTLIVFWSAHVYAGTITGHGAEVSLGRSFVQAIRHSFGMLYAAIPASLVLALGVLHVLSDDDAVSLALTVNLVILGVLGFAAFTERGSPVIIRILGALGTAFFGLLMIILNLIVH